jgi:hypothetical protein
MRRWWVWALVLVLLLGGFYVAWPAWSARQINQAIAARDSAALARKIDFPRVRERAKPIVAAEMERSVDAIRQKAGPIGGAIAGQIKASLGTRIVDAAVDGLLTPDNVIDMVRQGQDFRKAMRRVSERTGGAGGGGTPRGAADPPAPGQAGEPRRLGLANVKGLRLTGLTSLAIDVARDAAAGEPDVTVEMAFTGGDWRVVGLLPRL